MKIYNEIPTIAQSVITIGSFDGVHIGHKHLLESTKKIAQAHNCDEYILTFDPHPRLVLSHNNDFKLLTTKEEKIALFQQYGVRNVIFIPFTLELSALTAEDFIQQYILDKLNPNIIVLGYDHKFGKDRKGSMDTFKKFQNNYNFELKKVEEYSKDKLDKISSTTIRKLLNQGNIEDANQILDYTYSISGKVVEGKKIGRTIGFPTANIATDTNKLIPRKGVYATTLTIDNKIYKAATNIGHNPTIDSLLPMTIESYILDFDDAIYGKEVSLSFNKYIRDEIKYDSLDLLIYQIEKDVKIVRAILT